LNVEPRRPPVDSAVRPPQSSCSWPKGFFIVAPNQAQVLQLFGSYVGTAKTPGAAVGQIRSTRNAKLSSGCATSRARHLKVNDANANPIEIAAVVVWRVVESAEAVFEVDDYENYVKVQTEAAVRNLATSYPYDSHDEAVPR
jgi:regulator of protease activity HflC (stomatin/prohibitin superfamily)